jgi:hypothetical protein
MYWFVETPGDHRGRVVETAVLGLAPFSTDSRLTAVPAHSERHCVAFVP